MAGEKRFRTSLFGFNKSDVNYYIEKILREFENKLKEKDDEISTLKTKNSELQARYDEVSKKSNQSYEEKAKVASALIKAQEAADLIVEEARKQAEEEKKKLEGMIEEKREELVDIKEQLKVLKADVIYLLKKFDEQLDGIINEDAIEEAEETEEFEEVREETAS